MAGDPHKVELGSVADAWADEVASLMPAGRPFDGFVEYGKRVSPTCLVHLERNRYSVPASFANRPVSLRLYPDRFLVVAEGQVMYEHRRIIDRSHNRPGRTIYDWRHYLALVQRKPGALRNGAPFLDLPDPFQRLQRHLLRSPGGDREMVEILALVRVLSAAHALRSTPIPETQSELEGFIAFGVRHEAFHEALCSGCDSPWLLKLRQTLYVQSERYRRMSNAARTSKRRLRDEHDEIAKAVLARDLRRTSEVVEAHFNKTAQLLLEAMAREELAAL